MSIPKDLSTLEQMQNMKNMIGDGFIEFLKPSIKAHQNENVLKMLDLAKEKPESCIELLSVAIFHHNIPVIKHIIEKLNLTENDSPYINALNFHNSIFPDNSPNKLTDAKEAFIDIQIPFILMAGISGHIDIFEYLMNQKLIINKKINGVIGLSKKNKNILYSNVIGACAFYGKYKLLDFILKNFKDELDIGFFTSEKKAKTNKMGGLLKEYTGCTPALLAVVGLAEDKDAFEVLKILNQYNAKFDNTNWNKDNILHLATRNKKIECAKYICEELGLKNLLNNTNKEGYSPLSLAQHLNEENFISLFHGMNEDDEKKGEENWKELLEESVNKETKKGKKKKGKKKGKNNDIENDIPGYLASSDYQETLKEIVPKKSDDENNKNKLHELLETPSAKKGKKKKKENNDIINNKKENIEEEYEEEIREESKEKEDIKEKSNPKPEEEDDIIIGLNFKNNKKNKKLKQVDKSRTTLNNKKEKEKEKPIPNKETKTEHEINNDTNQIEIEIVNNQEIKKEEEIKEEKKISEQSEEVKKEKKIKPKKTKKEKRKDKESTDDFVEQMRKREKEKQEIKRIEEEKKRKEQEEKEQKEREEQQRILEEEKIRKEQEEKQRLEELKKLEEEKLRQEEENHKKEEEEEKSDKESLSLSEEENNNINNNNNISEEKEEEKEATVSMEDYERLNKNYLDLEKRLSILEKEKSQLTSCLTKLYLENKSKTENVPNSDEENINDLMYLANKELANKNEIINDLENKLTMLDLTNIKNFSVEKLKKFKEFYDKNLQIINDAMK